MMASILDDNSFISVYEKYEDDIYLSMKIFRAIIFNVCNLNWDFFFIRRHIRVFTNDVVMVLGSKNLWFPK